MKMSNLFRLFGRVTAGLVALVSLTSCAKDPYELDIVGYDYTDRPISDFSVNGAWGGNVELSTKTAGGGKYACCVRLNRNVKTPFAIDVEYQMGSLVDYATDKILEPESEPKKTRVDVTGPIPERPGYLEVHFYPDGHIEAAISSEDGPSPPRLKLETRKPYVR
jgi:hypothetical protein